MIFRPVYFTRRAVAVFSLVLFRKTAAGEARSADKKQRDTIYLVCGIGILASMAWSVVAG